MPPHPLDDMKTASMKALYDAGDSYTAEPITIRGRHEVAARLMDGALVYLHPSVARRFGQELMDAAEAAGERIVGDRIRSGS